jgi:hypothetical protein
MAKELEMISRIEDDMKAARRQSRFEDMLHHLDEIFVFYLHADNDTIRARCAAVLAGPRLHLVQ